MSAAPIVAPHAGAWIETRSSGIGGTASSSPLTQGRGLKLHLDADVVLPQSRPSRRGVD